MWPCKAAQFTSKQYIIKRAGMADMFVPYDDRSHTYYDMSFGNNRLDQIDAADLPPQNARPRLLPDIDGRPLCAR